MSAANRGAKRVDADFYPTPIPVIHNFLENHRLKDGAIFEPCAGNGNFIMAIRQKGYRNKIIANEIRKEENQNLLNAGATYIDHYDFLQHQFKDKDIKTLITNPPYSTAEDFFRKSKEQFPEAEIIMLLRLAFLESKKRYDFWQQYPVNKLYILSQRPSFTGKGTDATAYAWFVWNNSGKQEIKVI